MNWWSFFMCKLKWWLHVFLCEMMCIPAMYKPLVNWTEIILCFNSSVNWTGDCVYSIVNWNDDFTIKSYHVFLKLKCSAGTWPAGGQSFLFSMFRFFFLEFEYSLRSKFIRHSNNFEELNFFKEDGDTQVVHRYIGGGTFNCYALPMVKIIMSTTS